MSKHALIALVTALAIGGCLDDPAPLDCTTAPDNPACRTPDAAGPVDGATPDVAEPDAGDPADAGAEPADAGGSPADDGVSPADEGVPPADASVDPPDEGPPVSACADVVCDTPPAARCVQDVASTFNPVGRCQPLTCDGEPECDPVQLECAGIAACFFNCVLAVDGGGEGDGCLERCRAEGSPEGVERFDLVDACADESGCDDGTFDCLRARCGAELAACTGPEMYVWFVRLEADDYACDYALAPVEDCTDGGRVCVDGVCGGSLCEPNPCVDPPASECRGDGRAARRYDPVGACEVQSGTVECSYRIIDEDCDAGSSCRDGECVFPDCLELGCIGRLRQQCDGAGFDLTEPCTREEICEDGGCSPIPEMHGQACRVEAERRRCAEAGLECGGVAAIQRCLLPGAPLAVGETCWTAADCRPGALCTLSGRCSAGESGDPCLEDDDCQTACGRAGACL